MWRSVHHPALLAEGDPAGVVFHGNAAVPAATFSFDVKGGAPEAFGVLNALQIVKLAVSLGGTESLASPSRLDRAFGRAGGNHESGSGSAMRRSASRSASSIRTTSWPTRAGAFDPRLESAAIPGFAASS